MPPLQPGDPGEGGGDDHEPVGGPDESDVDDVGFRPPLPPEDRLWRHPSEVGRVRDPQPTARPHGRRTAGLALLSGAAGAAVALAAAAVVGMPGDRVVERRVELRPATVLDGEVDVAALVEEAAPSVAALVVHRGGEESAGSAVVLRSDGHLVTDAAVVAGADAVDVVLHDGTVVGGEVLGADEATGVAVVHVDATDLRPAAVARAGSLGAGTRTVLVAATTDDGWSTWASSGIVSALDRRVEGVDGTVRYGMIVVDKPFVDGAAGGALVDAGGAVVGVASGVRPGGSASTGLATPIELAAHVADQLIAHGHVQHVWLGLHGVDLDPADARHAGDRTGALVEDVVAGGPAARAGIEAGEVILGLGGRPTASMAALISALRLHLPGDVVELRLWSRGAERRVEVVLAAKPA